MIEPEDAVETRDVDTTRVLVTAGLLALTIALAAAVCWLLLVAWQASTGVGPDAPASLQARARDAEPSAPQEDRDAYFAEKNRLINGWQWLDRRAGTARIPIDVAMEAMVARSAVPKGGQR
ncbi:MAG: hypothetical protein ACM3Y9_14850 [Ignavibacteria bacterium]